MISMLVALALVLLTWAGVAAVLVGLGLLLRRRVPIGLDGLLVAFWLGYAICILYLQLWHLALPVRAMAAVPLVIGGIAGLAPRIGDILRWGTGAVRTRPMLALIVALAMLWIANRGMGPGDAHDSGLYHYSAICWMHEHAIVPGLANLHIRLGFNTSSLLFTALLDSGPWYGRGNHLANALLLASLLAAVVMAGARLLRSDGSPAASAFTFLLLVPAMALAVSKEVSSPTTDLPVVVMSFATAIVLWRVLVTPPAEENIRSADVLAVLLLAATVVCLKLSAAVFAALAGVTALVWCLRNCGQYRRRTVAFMVLGGLLLIGPWLVRGVILNGHLLFPSRWALPVQWAVPRPLVETELANIHTWSRLGRAEFVNGVMSRLPWKSISQALSLPPEAYSDAGGIRWLRPWIMGAILGAPAEVALPLVMILIGAIALAVRRRAPKSAWPMLICIGGAIAFWLIAAPEPRFGWFLLWIAAAALVAMLPLRPRLLVVTMIVLSLLPVAHRMAVLGVYYKSNPLRSIPLVPPGADHGFHPTPQVPMTTYTTRHGLLLLVPEVPFSCWQAPLPCTGYPNPDLRLRRPGDLGSGFVVDSGEPTPTR